MDDLKNDLFLKVQEHAALALNAIAKMPKELANPQLIVLADLEKASSQIAALTQMKKDVLGVGEVLQHLIGRIADFLSIPEDQLPSTEDLIEQGAKREQDLVDAMPDKAEARWAAEEASGAKYRDAIRKAIAQSFENVVPKGGNIFSHDGGSFFLAFYQKSGSTAKELKFSINKETVAELRSMDDASIYLVGKNGLVAEVAMSALDGKEIDASRWEFFVTLADDSVAGVTGNRRAFAIEHDQFQLAVSGSAD